MLTQMGQGPILKAIPSLSLGLWRILPVAMMLALPATFATWAHPALAETDEGHADEDEGSGGHGKGRHGRHHNVVPPVSPPVAESGNQESGRAGSGRSLAGGYLRAEMGLLRSQPDNSSWLPPGYPVDPQVFFDLGSDTGGFAGLAIGQDWGNGLRGEVELMGFGSTEFSGPWSYTEPETPGPHASVTGSVRSVALMGNIFYEPFQNRKSKTVPYVMMGVGLADNQMSDWTRINPEVDREERSFAGASNADLALSVGFGVSMEVGKTKKGDPMTFEVGYRYFDLGTAQGGTTPLPGSGQGGEPVGALKMNQSSQLISVGIRIPLRGL
jgi:opacity protein-like surface antigen